MLTDRRRTHACSEHGFSLVELLVAMVVTLIVTGAIYGLLASGQNAFRREPLLTERQQNIRSAMDIIQADIATAGAGLPLQFQVFANGSSGVANTPDFLQMYTYDGNCPVIPAGVQSPSPNPAPVAPNGRIVLDRPAANCWGAASGRGLFAAQAATGGMYIGMATLDTASPAPLSLVFDANGTPLSTCNVLQPCSAVVLTQNTGPVPTDFVMPIKVIRYEIGPASSTDTMPCLWRSETGGRDITVAGAGVFKPVNVFPNSAGNWRLVARGIINMKAGYLPASTALPAASPATGNPPAMPSPNTGAAVPGNVVRSVVVTLTAQTEIQLAAGQPVSPFQADLTSVTTPRAALANLANVGGALQWH